MSKNRSFVYLTGGLGNQLFQLAASIYFSNDETVVLERNLGKPRENSSGIPDICEFALPTNVKLSKKTNRNIFLNKLAGYLLRSGIEPKHFEKFALSRIVIAGIGKLSFIIYYRKWIKLNVSQDVGYHEFNDSKGSKFFIGYFQTHKWLSSKKVFETLIRLRIESPSTNMLNLIAMAQVKNPLIVHIRLGDYRNEKSFGLIGPKYYFDAIAEIWDDTIFQEIWIFSDEPESAKTIFTNLPGYPVRFIEDPRLSSAETLEVMRHGRGYVIANSTFSWWAASLSYTPLKTVIYPKLWFRSAQIPKELIPTNWLPREPYFDFLDSKE